MELKVWVEGIQRIVCGVTDKTTCQVRKQKKLFLKKFWIFPPKFFWPKKKEDDDKWNFPCDQFIQRSSLIEGFFIFPVKLSLHFCIYIVSIYKIGKKIYAYKNQYALKVPWQSTITAMHVLQKSPIIFQHHQKRLKKSKFIGSFFSDFPLPSIFSIFFFSFFFGVLCITSQFHKEETCKKNSETFFY